MKELNEDQSCEGIQCFKGMLIALPIGILLWVLIIGTIFGIVRCFQHTEPKYESVGGKFEILVTNIVQDIK